jgi:predicted transcriptional regulator
MEVHLKPGTESRLQELATKTGRAPDELLEDALAGYLQELGSFRDMLDHRYDDVKSGRVQLLDGEDALANLQRKSNDRRSGCS